MSGLRVLAAALGAAVAVGIVSAPAQAALPEPKPSVELPSQIDLPAFYEPQTICKSKERPGTRALRELLIDTYGPATAYATRTCTSSTSEHFDGRALDWMRDKRVPEQKAMADAFIDWLLAPAPDGTPQEMARRMGIMYIIWNGRMIRMYDVGRGWTEYRGCRSTSRGKAYDTTCHRNHVHFSLSWNGAAAMTSWYSGTAQTLPWCSSRYTSADPGPGTPAKVKDPTALPGFVSVGPKTIINTRNGYGYGGTLSSPCRLLAGRTLFPKVRLVPPDAEAVVLKVIAESNAPSRLSVWSSGGKKPRGQVFLPITTRKKKVMVVPIASDGTVAVSTSVGAARVRIRVIGYVPDADALK